MSKSPANRGAVTLVGGRFLDGIEYIGGLWLLLGETVGWIARGVAPGKTRLGVRAIADQVVRLGVRSTPIVLLVQFLVGVILALQMAPPLEPFGYMSMVANIISIAVFRELGPLLAGVVLSGFAGASIAAELGAMVVGEEIEALRAHAIHPVRFLVVPRVIAVVLAMIGLTALSNIAGCLGGYVSSLTVLGPEAHHGYWQAVVDQVGILDLMTGLIKAGVFGLLLGLLACFEGLNVKGGAEGVGRATTMTVVYTIVGLAVVDCIFTVIFFVYDL